MTRRPPIATWLIAAVVIVLGVTSCTTSSGAGDVTVTASRASSQGNAAGPEPEATSATTPAAIEVIDPATMTEDPAATSPENSADSTAVDRSSVDSTKTTTTKQPKKPKTPAPVVTVTPRDTATKVGIRDGIRVTVAKGTLVSAKIVNPSDKVVYHSDGSPNTAWEVVPALGFGKRYRVIVVTKDVKGRAHRHETSFVTESPRRQIAASVFPTNLSTVGVGQPIRITFNNPIESIAAKRTVEAMITVKTHPVQKGTFRWFSDTELRWRPAKYFLPNSSVRVYVDIYGRNMNRGSLGAADTKVLFKIGRSMITTVDASTHQLAVRKNGTIIKTMPASLGTDKYPTYNGVHIVTEKFASKVMDSTTWGLRGAGQYRTKVRWATRISNTGEFVHGAPWSEYAQGNQNVSHGCINVSDSRAKWFYDNALPGDVVIVKNSSGPTIESWDGFGDWNIPYASY